MKAGILLFLLFQESAVVLVDDARTPRNIAQERVFHYPALSLDPITLKSSLEKKGIFSRVRVLEKEELDFLYSLPSDKRISFLKEKTGERYLLAVQILRYEKSQKFRNAYNLKFRYELIDMEDLEVISSARLKSTFSESGVSVNSITNALKRCFEEKRRDETRELSILATLRPFPERKVKEFVNIHKTAMGCMGVLLLDSFIFPYTLRITSGKQRYHMVILSTASSLAYTQLSDMFHGDISWSGGITGAFAGSILAINSLFWFNGLYSDEPLIALLEFLGVFFLSAWTGCVAGIDAGKKFSLEEEIDGIPVMKKFASSTMLGMSCMGDSGWTAFTQERVYFFRNGYFLTLSCSMGAYEENGEILPLAGAGGGLGCEVKTPPTRILTEIFLSTPYEYGSYGYFQTEINLSLLKLGSFYLSPYLRKKIPLSQKILKDYDFWRGIEAGIGFELRTD